MSLEALDPLEMEKVQYGDLGRRDPRRAPITNYREDMESLLSLTEEEAGSGSQVFSFPEVRQSRDSMDILILHIHTATNCNCSGWQCVKNALANEQ